MLALVSLLWVLWQLKHAWPTLAMQLKQISPMPLIVGQLLCLFVAAFVFLAFHATFNAISTKKRALSWMAHYFFTSQLLRHLPGRFFGFAYQIGKTRNEISGVVWVATNLIHMGLLMFLTILVSICVLLAFEHAYLSMVFFVLGLALLTTIWSSEVLGHLGRWLQKSKIPFRGMFGRLCDASSKLQRRNMVLVLGFLVCSWGLHFAAWGLFGEAHPLLSFFDGAYLAALYSLAWLVGFFSIITPSGLGVREAAFATFAIQQPADVVAYFLILGRASLLIVDLLLGLLFIKSPKGKPVESTL